MRPTRRPNLCFLRSPLLLLGLGMAVAAVAWLAAAADAVYEKRPPPVSVFADLDGRWVGTFQMWSVQGEELERLAVEQTYRTVDDETQLVEIVDRTADGGETRSRGRNIARYRADGSLDLVCQVERSGGERVEHRGRLGRDPEGRLQVVWWSEEPGRLESFRETVSRQGEEGVYTIDGVGRYGDRLVIMAGRYRRLAPDGS